MTVQEQVLSTALRICRENGGWTFGVEDVVRALPHLHAGTVRTHVTSRLCVNAPANHPHRWPYFRRVGRGRYELLSAYRTEMLPRPAAPRPRKHLFMAGAPRPLRDTAHVVVSRDIGWYVAECLEIPVVAQGRTLDEVVAGVRLGIERKLALDDASRFGLAKTPRILLVHELRLSSGSRRS